jgi:hypothetical protein
MPDYLIVGGKRCGTTSLQAYLAGHPQVVAPHSGKGTHYFDENYTRGEAWFRGHYPFAATMALHSRRAGGPVVTGEASPYYSFHPTSFERIAALLPEVKLVFVLRDPVERAFSHWRYERRDGHEDLDFRDALEAEDERLAGEEERLRADPGYVSWAHRHYSYFTRGLYAEQVERCLASFPAEQLLLLRFDELVQGSGASERLCTFLGIDPDTGHVLPRLESGRDNATPDPETMALLERRYAPANQALYERFGVDFR